MDNLVVTQLITSFFVGGGVITLQTFLAEKVPVSLRSVVLVFPSTIALSFFFLGWAISPEEVARVAPVTGVGMGVATLFAFSYLHLSRVRLGSKMKEIAFSVFIALIFWFACMLPIAYFEFNGIIPSVAIYLAVVVSLYFLLTKRTAVSQDYKPFVYTTGQRIARFVFVGFVISASVLLAKTLGPFWGGIMGLFPAVYTSSLVIFQYYYDSDYLFQAFHNMPLASPSVTIYGFSTMYTFPAYGIVWGTVASYALSVTYAILSAKLMKKPR